LIHFFCSDKLIKGACFCGVSVVAGSALAPAIPIVAETAAEPPCTTD